MTGTVGKPEDELYVKNYPIIHYENLGFLKSISLVHKLRETRVFQGFKRIAPDGDSEPAQISVNKMPWLPAIKNSGEGIMFEFDQEKLLSWACKEKIIARTKIIEQNLKNSGKFKDEILNPAYVLFHTFGSPTIPNFIFLYSPFKTLDFQGFVWFCFFLLCHLLCHFVPVRQHSKHLPPYQFLFASRPL